MFKKIPTQSSKNGKPSDPDINRLLTAAVINQSFRSLLLSNPAQAIAGGYCGERFNIGSKTANQVKAIHAASLADFASQLTNF